MFKNAGKKIKTLAKVLFIVEVIITVVYFFGQLIGYYHAIRNIPMLLTCIVVIAFFILVFYAKNVALYAFGELVDNSSKIRNDLEETKILNNELLEKVSNLENK